VLKNPGEGWKVIIRPGEVTDQLGGWTDGPPYPREEGLTLTVAKRGKMHKKNCGFGRNVGLPGSAAFASQMCDL
jgi:hypothetical protein